MLHNAMSRRFQFSLRALLVAVFGVACFFGGVSWQRHLDKPIWWGQRSFGTMHSDFVIQEMVMPDGEIWKREGRFSGWEVEGKLSEEDVRAAKDEM